MRTYTLVLLIAAAVTFMTTPMARHLEALLRAQPNLDVLVHGVDTAGEPTYRLDPDGRVHSTAVLYTGPGWVSDRDVALDDHRRLTVATWQVTCVGGDRRRALLAATKTRAAITNARIPGGTRAREALDSLTVLEDTAATPARWYVPIRYTADIA